MTRSCIRHSAGGVLPVLPNPLCWIFATGGEVEGVPGSVGCYQARKLPRIGTTATLGDRTHAMINKVICCLSVRLCAGRLFLRPAGCTVVRVSEFGLDRTDAASTARWSQFQRYRLSNRGSRSALSSLFDEGMFLAGPGSSPPTDRRGRGVYAIRSRRVTVNTRFAQRKASPAPRPQVNLWLVLARYPNGR